MADPDPQMGGGEGAVIQTLVVVVGGPRSPKKFYSSFRPHFGRKIRGGASPGSATGIIVVWFKLLKSRIRNCDFSNNTIS